MLGPSVRPRPVARPTGREEEGFTLLELLLAATIVALILAAMGGLLATSSRATGAHEAASKRQQEIEAAVKILSYDLGLAGYRGTTPAEFAVNTFSDPTIEVLKSGATASGNDRLVIRYFEDTERLFGGADTCGRPCVVTYDIDSGEDGTLLLYRQEGNSEERGIVQEVDRFLVCTLFRRSGTPISLDSAPAGSVAIPEDLAALNIEITFTDGTVWRFPVGVTNPFDEGDA